MLLIISMTYQSTSAQSRGSLKAIDLRAEYLENPIGIDITKPRLSWIVTSVERAQNQSAYQIVIASNPTALEKSADLWDTGKVISSETNHIIYAGKQLKSRMQIYWKVRSWDNNDIVSEWSDVATWSMGLLSF